MHAWSRSPRQRGEDIRAHACSSGSSEAGNAAHIVMSPVLATTSPDTCSSGCYIGRGRVVTLSHDTPNSVCLQVESHVSAVALEAWIDPADPLVCACARIYQRFNTNPVRSVVHSQAWQLIWKLPTKRRRRQTDLMWSCGLGELCRSRKQLATESRVASSAWLVCWATRQYCAMHAEVGKTLCSQLLLRPC